MTDLNVIKMDVLQTFWGQTLIKTGFLMFLCSRMD